MTSESTSSDIAIRGTWAEFLDDHADPRQQLLRSSSAKDSLILSSEQFGPAEVERVFAVADRLRQESSNVGFNREISGVLSGRSCALYFPQCSTRTFVSFSLAAQALGMMVEEIRDPELSAEYKGESELDTLLALAQLADLVVIREKGRTLLDRFAFEIVKRGATTRIINGGTGADQHPTQSLLDLYTLRIRMNLRASCRKRIAFVGDLRRSRTARSLALLLSNYRHVEQVYVAPADLQMESDVIRTIEARGVSVSLSESFDAVLPHVDAVYMMRMQDEYSHTSDDQRRGYAEYHLTPDRIPLLRPEACVLHPLPRRDELPLEFDYDPRAAYWPAVGLGKTVRKALILTMFGIGVADLSAIAGSEHPSP